MKLRNICLPQAGVQSLQVPQAVIPHNLLSCGGEGHAIRDENKDLLGVIIAVLNINSINETLASVDLGKWCFFIKERSDNTKLISQYPSNNNVDT